jgi:predicted AAA+ superfamily ATPase
VLFCDDLSFESGEGDYRVLKSVLDGSLEQAPDNVLLYATSNRRHLVPEKESDNENWKRVDGELHPSEAVEDKIASRTVSVCGCRSIRSPRSISSMWSNTGSASWPPRPA